MSIFNGQHYLPLDDAPAQRHSPTSVAAAKGQTKEKRGTQRAKILELLSACGPLTDEEIGERLGLSGDSVRPRRVSLVEDGLVVQAGEGTTRGGKRAVKWGRT
jgi:predicted ArsR family transcriptional regulator